MPAERGAKEELGPMGEAISAGMDCRRSPRAIAGRAVVVTGASSGLGLATAVHLAELGFRVFAGMRDVGRRGELDREASRRGVPVEVLQLDVTDRASIEIAVSTVLSRAGTPYGLVNNAGIQLRGYFEDSSEAEARRVFETNVFGTMALTRAVMPHLRAEGRGRIVIVTSVGGRIGSPALSIYCASKFALEGFGEALALESRLIGVDVILVEPAVVRTEIWTRNRGVAEGARSPQSPYRDWFRNEERLSDRLVARAPTRALDVAKAIGRALTSERPRLRYVVGRRARLLLSLRDGLPGEIFERLYATTLNRLVNRRSLAGEV